MHSTFLHITQRDHQTLRTSGKDASFDSETRASSHLTFEVYGDFVALNNVNMATYKSQVTVLLGHNGAGKTTLMNILTGFIEPNSGSVLVSGRDVRSAGFERMGFCPQFDALFADLTVSEHLSYFGGIKGLDSEVLPRRIHELLKDVRLADKANALPEELSGGMKRKLCIALALLTRPKVLILDEPTAGIRSRDAAQHMVFDKRTAWQSKRTALHA
ncbi:hypothetical protein MTO96_007830 [Rhipicephalus appendiculatus]